MFSAFFVVVGFFKFVLVIFCPFSVQVYKNKHTKWIQVKNIEEFIKYAILKAHKCIAKA